MIEEISWTFYGYQTAAGGRNVQEWFDGLLAEEREEAADTIGYLQRLPLASWGKPQYHPLGGGLSEIRFTVNLLHKTYRIYGCFWPRKVRLSYTLLLGNNKKVKNPKHDVKESRKRKDWIEEGKASIHEFEF